MAERERSGVIPASPDEARAAFGRVFDRQGARLCRISFFLCGDPGQAERVVAHAFAVAWRFWITQRVDDLEPFLLSEVVRLSLRETRWYRLVGRQRPTVEPALVRQLLELPSSERAAVVLRHLEGLEDAEIAEALALPSSAVVAANERGAASLADGGAAIRPAGPGDPHGDGKAAVLADHGGSGSPGDALRQSFIAAGVRAPGLAPSRGEVALLVRHSRHRRALIACVVILILALVAIVSLTLTGSSSSPSRAVVDLKSPPSSGPVGLPGSGGVSTTTTSTIPGSGSGGVGTVGPNTTSVAAQALAPAAEPPVVSECSESVNTTSDGNVSPLYCSDGGVNVLAWQAYAKLNPSVLSLARGSTSSQVLRAMCTDVGSSARASVAQEASAEALAARYNGWPFNIRDFSGASCRTRRSR